MTVRTLRPVHAVVVLVTEARPAALLSHGLGARSGSPPGVAAEGLAGAEIARALRAGVTRLRRGRGRGPRERSARAARERGRRPEKRRSRPDALQGPTPRHRPCALVHRGSALRCAGQPNGTTRAARLSRCVWRIAFYVRPYRRRLQRLAWAERGQTAGRPDPRRGWKGAPTGAPIARSGGAERSGSSVRGGRVMVSPTTVESPGDRARNRGPRGKHLHRRSAALPERQFGHRLRRASASATSPQPRASP